MPQRKISLIILNFHGLVAFLTFSSLLCPNAGLLQQTHYGHQGRVLALAINPEQSFLASAGDDRQVLVWGLETKTIQKKLIGHSAKVQDLQFLPDNRLVSVSENGQIIIWDPKTGEDLFQLAVSENRIATSLDVHPTGQLLVTGMGNGQIRLFDLKQRQHLGDFQIHTGIVWTVAFSPDGKYIATGSEDRMVCLWQVDLQKVVATSEDHSGRVWTLDFHPTDGAIVSGDWSGAVRLWTPFADPNQFERKEFLYDHPILETRFSPSGNLVAVGTAGTTSQTQLIPTIRLLDFASQKEIYTFYNQTVHNLEITSDGTTLFAVGQQDGGIISWSVSNDTPKLIQPENNQIIELTTNVQLVWQSSDTNLYSIVQVGLDVGFSNRYQSAIQASPAGLRIVPTLQGINTSPTLGNEIVVPPSSTYWWRVQNGNFNHLSRWSAARKFRFKQALRGQVLISPGKQQVKLREDFSFSVWIEEVKNLASFQFDVKWSNPEAIHFITTTHFNEVFPENAEVLGPIRSQLQDKEMIEEPFFQVDRQSGRYKNIVAVKKGEDDPRETGRLIQILCRANQTGNYQISVENLVFLDDSLVEIPVEITQAEITIQEEVMPWDVNFDGVVDIFDLSSVARYYGQNVAWDYNPDVNRDGKVDLFDFVLIAAHFGESYNTSEPIVEHAAPLSSTQDGGWYQIYLPIDSAPPSITRLLPNYPNPTNPETWIPFQLAQPSKASVYIHTVSGQRIRVLDLGYLSTGYYVDRSQAAYWDGKNSAGETVPSGIYFYTLEISDFLQTQKMMVVQ